MPRQYYIFTNGRLRRKDNTIYVEAGDGKKRAIPVEDVESLHLFGEVELNTKALNFLAQKQKPVHVYNYYGFYSGSFMPRERLVSGELTVEQVKHFLDRESRLYIAISFVEGAIFRMIRNLREYTGTEQFIEAMRKELVRALEAKDVSQLMGCEGRAKDAYYSAFEHILKEDFLFEKRTKRPPRNPVNALISFGNSLIYSTVLSELYHTQLNPAISYLHEPGSRRYSLSLDLAEIFKPLMVDPVIFKLINNRMLRLEDFEKAVNFCYLTENGRKKFLKEFDKKLSTTIKHRRLRRKVSYRRLIRLECYKLIKHLLGDELYKPFKAWW